MKGNAMKKRFTSKELLDLGLPSECIGGKVISDVIVGKSRWSVLYSVIWQHPDGNTYQATYRVGATESQDESPWDSQAYVDALQVHEVERLMKVWEPIPEPVAVH